ncbi:MAG TPA: alpha/beta hydrolase [Acidimicrobiales bacterium]|nr:alpha/beta hydrolase [Acidimicrobiales bacterium]
MERIEYDEFGLFHENAEEFGIPYDGPPVVRRESTEVDPGRKLSALVWGTSDPSLVFLHGGAQNAHTWDTVALALARPLVAIDLPGHGHSDGGRHGSLSLTDNAEDVAKVIRALAPNARGVVGMSLGGLTTLALSTVDPDVVRSIVLVDVLPSVQPDSAKVIADFINGPESFPSFDEILARTIEYNPTRSVSSLRRGILHNAEQRDDGSWVWRHARHRASEPAEESPAIAERFGQLWNAVSAVKVPLLLVRGMRPQSVVDDAHEAELLRRLPSARVEHVQEAGHSVQGDAPLELARLIQDFIPEAETSRRA